MKLQKPPAAPLSEQEVAHSFWAWVNDAASWGVHAVVVNSTDVEVLRTQPPVSFPSATSQRPWRVEVCSTNWQALLAPGGCRQSVIVESAQWSSSAQREPPGQLGAQPGASHWQRAVSPEPSHWDPRGEQASSQASPEALQVWVTEISGPWQLPA